MCSTVRYSFVLGLRLSHFTDYLQGELENGSGKVARTSTVPRCGVGQTGIRHSDNLLCFLQNEYHIQFSRPSPRVARRRQMNYHHVKTLTTLHIMPSRVVHAVNVRKILGKFLRNLTRSRIISNVPRRATKVRNMGVIRVTYRYFNAANRRNVNRKNVRATTRTGRLANLKRRCNILRLTTPMYHLRGTKHSTMRTISLSSPINRRVSTMMRILMRVQFLHRRSSQLNANLLRRGAKNMNMMKTINTRSTRPMVIRPFRIESNSYTVSSNIRTRHNPGTLRVKMMQMTKTIRNIIGNMMSRNTTRVALQNIKRFIRVRDKRFKENRKDVLFTQILRRGTTRHTTTMHGTSRTIFFIRVRETHQGGPFLNRLLRLYRNNVRPLNANRLDMDITTNRNNRDAINLLRLLDVNDNRHNLNRNINYLYNGDEDERRHKGGGDRYTRNTRGTVEVYFRLKDSSKGVLPGGRISYFRFEE